MNAKISIGCAAILCTSSLGCANLDGEPDSLREARLRQALELKQACVRYHAETGMAYGTASAINSDCWDLARRATGLR